MIRVNEVNFAEAVSMAIDALRAGKNVVIDYTALTPDRRQRFSDDVNALATAYNLDVGQTNMRAIGTKKHVEDLASSLEAGPDDPGGSVSKVIEALKNGDIKLGVDIGGPDSGVINVVGPEVLDGPDSGLAKVFGPEVIGGVDPADLEIGTLVITPDNMEQMAPLIARRLSYSDIPVDVNVKALSQEQRASFMNAVLERAAAEGRGVTVTGTGDDEPADAAAGGFDTAALYEKVASVLNEAEAASRGGEDTTAIFDPDAECEKIKEDAMTEVDKLTEVTIAMHAAALARTFQMDPQYAADPEYIREYLGEMFTAHNDRVYMIHEEAEQRIEEVRVSIEGDTRDVDFEDVPQGPGPYDLLSTGNTSGHDWACAFMQTIREQPGIVIDRGFMMAWFANAIETARSAGYAAGEKNIREQIGEAIRGVSGAAVNAADSMAQAEPHPAGSVPGCSCDPLVREIGEDHITRFPFEAVFSAPTK